MSSRVLVLAAPAAAAGFRLAGLAVEEVGDPRDAEGRLALASAQPDLGILLVEQALLDAVPEAARRVSERRAVPILIPIPKPQWDGANDRESFIVELLCRAIGYRVRLQ